MNCLQFIYNLTFRVTKTHSYRWEFYISIRLDGQKIKTDENVRVKWCTCAVARRASNEHGFSSLQDRRKVFCLLNLYFKTVTITNSSCMYLSLATVRSRMRFVHCSKHNSTNSVLDKLTIPQLLNKFPSLMDLEGPLQCRPQVSVFKANKFSPQHTIPPSFFRTKDCKSTKHEVLLNPEIAQVRNRRIENGIDYYSAARSIFYVMSMRYSLQVSGSCPNTYNV